MCYLSTDRAIDEAVLAAVNCVEGVKIIVYLGGFLLFLIVLGFRIMHAMLSLRYTLFSWVVLQVHGSWVDPDTPENSLITDAMSPGDERSFELVRWNRPE